MSAYVIDTNVGIVANGENCPQADPQCILSCIKKLKECVSILNGDSPGMITIDSGGEILGEYKKYLSFSGQPGVGDLFFKELFQRQMMPSCDCVDIAKDAEWGYEEFPHDKALMKFDPPDRKFVAVAVHSQHSPTILNATDSDWSEYEVPLSKYVNVEQLCPDCLKDTD